MSTTWQSLVIVGQPQYTILQDPLTVWVRTPVISPSIGFGFGQGGFGQGGFGGTSGQSGNPLPTWTPWSVD